MFVWAILVALFAVQVVVFIYWIVTGAIPKSHSSSAIVGTGMIASMTGIRRRTKKRS
jgi:hypothetical protein